MIFTRRDFLRSLAAMPAVLALQPYKGVTAQGNFYTNARLGLSLELPEGFEFSSVADFVALRERQILLDEVPGEVHPLKDPGELPVFIFESPDHRRDHFVPAITLWDEFLEEDVPQNQRAAHKKYLHRVMKEAYRGFKLLAQPTEIALKGNRATRSRWSYWHDVEEIGSYHLLIQTLLIFRPPRVQIMHLVDSAANPCIPPEVWERFIDTVCYQPLGRFQ